MYRDMRLSAIFLICIMNVKQAQIEKTLNVNLTSQLVLSKLAKFNCMDKCVDTITSNSYFTLFQSFFTQVCKSFFFKQKHINLIFNF